MSGHTRTIFYTSEEKIITYIEQLKQVNPSERKATFIIIAKKHSHYVSRHKENDFVFIGLTVWYSL